MQTIHAVQSLEEQANVFLAAAELSLGADIAHSAGPIRSLLIALVSFALSVCLVGASRVRGLGLLKRLY